MRKKCGLIYERIATRQLWRNYPEMDKKAQAELFEHGYDRVEKIVRIGNPITLATDAIRRALEWYGVFLHAKLDEVALWSSTPNADLELDYAAIQKRNLSDAKKAQIAFAALTALHNDWVQHHCADFFETAPENKQYLFLPIELIGMDAAMRNYLYVEDILIALGLHVEHQYLREHYARARHHYIGCCGVGIVDRNTLAEHISHTGYAPLTLDVIWALSRRKVALDIADRLIAQNGDPREW